MKGIVLAMISIGAFTCAVLADGIGFEGDRVAGCKTTVISLTSQQKETLDSGRKVLEGAVQEPAGGKKIQLTPEQMACLRGDAGFAPPELDVWALSNAKETCTCELLNMGIRFSADKVEIPHYLLGKDVDSRLLYTRGLDGEGRATSAPAITQTGLAMRWPPALVALGLGALVAYIAVKRAGRKARVRKIAESS